MVRRWSYINSINCTPMITTRHIQKASVDVNLNTLMYLKKKYSLATRLTRKQWTRRKHLYAWLSYSNILKDWARSYRFHRTGAKLTYYHFFTKNSFIAFNLVAARNSIPSLYNGSENFITGNSIKRFLRLFNVFATPRLKFFTSFKHTQVLMISLNSNWSPQLVQSFLEEQTSIVPLYVDTLTSLLPWRHFNVPTKEIQENFIQLMDSVFLVTLLHLLTLYKILILLNLQRLNYYLCP